jgi:hypothetical protein
VRSRLAGCIREAYFDISMYDACLVQVLYNIYELCKVKPSTLLFHSLQNKLLKFPSFAVLQRQIEFAATLKGTQTVYNTWVFQIFE